MKKSAAGARGSLRRQILVPFLATVLASLLAVIWYASDTLTDSARARAREALQGRAAEQAEAMSGLLLRARSVARSGTGIAHAFLQNENGFDRDLFAQVLRKELINNPDYIGFFGGFQADFDGQDRRYAGTDLGDEKGRFLLYAARDDKGVARTAIAPLTGSDAEKIWYDHPLQTRRTILTPPYLDDVLGVPTLMASIATPILDLADEAIGVISVDIPLTTLQKRAAEIKTYAGGSAMVVSHDDKWVATPDDAAVSRPVDNPELLRLLTDVRAGGSILRAMADPVTGVPSLVSATAFGVDGVAERWVLIVSAPESEVMAEAVRARWMMLAVG
ncbi:cache domain-containing protein, partial [Novispirillum itersonii]|uniref:cache domain-containing protein n=1 Tax=Novispirillum itersonii TaxID=189 RepID=UPI0012DCC66A